MRRYALAVLPILTAASAYDFYRDGEHRKSSPSEDLAHHGESHQRYESFRVSIPCMQELLSSGQIEYKPSRGINPAKNKGWHMFVPQGGDFQYHISCKARPGTAAQFGSKSSGFELPAETLSQCHLTARKGEDFRNERGRHSGQPLLISARYVCDARSPCLGKLCPFSYFHKKDQRDQCYGQLSNLLKILKPCLINVDMNTFDREATLKDDLHEQSLLGVLWTLGGALAVAAINFSAKFFASNRSPSNDDESGHATKDVECPEGAYDGPQYGALSP